MKKGVLFSIVTLLLFSSIIIFPVNQVHDIVTRLGYVEDDIVSGYSAELLDVESLALKRGANLTVELDTNVKLGHDYHQRVSSYEDFIEGKYSALQNIDVELEGFNASLGILPYGTRISYDPFMITDDATVMVGIHLIAQVNATNYTSVSDTRAPGSLFLKIVVMNSTGDEIYAGSGMYDAAGDGELIFDIGGDPLSFRFGSFQGYPDGTLLAEGSAETIIKGVRLDHVPDSRQTIIRSGTLFLQGAGMRKLVPIIIHSE